MMAISSAEVLSQLADMICAVKCIHPVRVAIDGVDAAGKTTLADILAPQIELRGRPVIRASVDGFHNPQKVRYRRGADSPEGYYRDSFNYEALQRDLLIPLGSGGDRRYRCSAFNYVEDAPTHEAWCEAPANAVLLFDGIFLLRPELVQYWDFSVFVDVDFSVSALRAVARDSQQDFGSSTPEAVRAKYNRRYIPGQKLYFAEARPKEEANVTVNNNDWSNPRLILRES
jgi:uridine kinase